jgi:hypothetical protein
MSIWSGSKYEGEHKDGWYHGKGKLHTGVKQINIALKSNCNTTNVKFNQ